MDGFVKPYVAMYGPICEKCLHPLERHGYVLTRTDGKEIRRCEIGVCSCVIMATK